MSCFVVVTGLPASGKSTIAKAIAKELGLPVLDKDELLENLFESRGVGDSQWRRELSRAADQELQRQAELSQGAVLVSWWKHPRSPLDSGTPIDWLASLPGLVEVHCQCSPEIAAERFITRRRHPGHLDDRWSYTDLLASFARQASLGPLHLGRLVEIQTEGPFDREALVRDVAHAVVS